MGLNILRRQAKELPKRTPAKLAGISFEYVLPSPLKSIPLNIAIDVLERISIATSTIEEIAKEYPVVTRFRIYQGSGISFHDFISKFHDQYSYHSQGFICDNGPLIASLNISAYDDQFSTPELRLPEEMSDEQKRQYHEEYEIAFNSAYDALAKITIETLRRANFPDLFDRNEHNTKEVLGKIYPEIRDMGKDIHGNNFTVHDVGTCDYTLEDSLETIKID